MTGRDPSWRDWGRALARDAIVVALIGLGALVAILAVFAIVALAMAWGIGR